MEKWPTLPAHIKAAVMALVGTAPSSSPPAVHLDDALPPAVERMQGKLAGG